MTLPLLPTVATDSAAQQRRIIESINGIISFQFDEWRRRTDAEARAGVMPIHSSFPPGDIRRYGEDIVGDGVTDMRAAFQAAFDQYAQGGAAVFVPAASVGWLCETPVLIPDEGVEVYGIGYKSRLLTSLSSPQNIFRTGDSSGLTGTEASGIRLTGLHFDGRRKDPAITIPGSRTRLNALVFIGTDPSLGSTYTSDIEVSGCHFSEAIHNHLSFETCDGVTVTDIIVDGNGLDAADANYIGNTDGVHFNNCRNFALRTARIDSGDDMVGITSDASAVGASYRGQISDIVGSSQEANGVVINGEGGSTTDIFDVQIDNVQFTSGSGQGTAARAKQIGTENISQITFTHIRARDCGAALDFTAVVDCHADAIFSENSTDHAIRLEGTTYCSLGRHSTLNAGNNTGNFCGVYAISNTRLKISGPGFHDRADLWGVYLDSNLNSDIDDIYARGCGRRTSVGANRGGIYANSNADCTLGSKLRAEDDGNSYTNYGLYVPADNRGVLLSPVENFSGVTLGLNNVAGMATTPGGPIAWAYITDNGTSATLAASKNIDAVTRNARGDYSLTYEGQIFRPSDGFMAVVTGSAHKGVDNDDLCVKPVSFALTSVRVKATNGAGGLANVTDLFVQIFGTYNTR